MITLGSFVLGLLIIAVGFFMIWKTHRWQEYVGSLNDILGYPQWSWLDWDTLGVLTMVIGAVVMFGLFQTFLMLTVSRLLRPSV